MVQRSQRFGNEAYRDQGWHYRSEEQHVQSHGVVEGTIHLATVWSVWDGGKGNKNRTINRISVTKVSVHLAREVCERFLKVEPGGQFQDYWSCPSEC